MKIFLHVKDEHGDVDKNFVLGHRRAGHRFHVANRKLARAIIHLTEDKEAIVFYHDLPPNDIRLDCFHGVNVVDCAAHPMLTALWGSDVAILKGGGLSVFQSVRMTAELDSSLAPLLLTGNRLLSYVGRTLSQTEKATRRQILLLDWSVELQRQLLDMMDWPIMHPWVIPVSAEHEIGMYLADLQQPA